MDIITRNAKIDRIHEKCLVIGIDVGSSTHFARAFDNRGREYRIGKKVFCFENTSEGFERFLKWTLKIREEAGKTEIMIGMEPTGHYWFNLGRYIRDQGFGMCLVNPAAVKKAKELADNDPSKDDCKDPGIIAGLVKDGNYSIPYMPEGIYAEIRNLYELRERVAESLVRNKNWLARWLAIYFPEYLQVYSDPYSISGAAILKETPLPEDILELGIEGICQIWRKHKMRGIGMKRAKALYEAAQKSIGCHTGREAARIEIRQLLEDMDRDQERIRFLNKELEERLKEVPNTDKVLRIPGISTIIMAGLIAEIGDPSRFTDPKQIQKLAGLAIRTNESGKHIGEKHISYRGRKRLRGILYRAALILICKNPEFAQVHAYFTGRTKNPLKKMQSVIAVGCKALRVIYTILTKGVEYDPSRIVCNNVQEAA